MKAAVVKTAGAAPVFAEFEEPVAGDGLEVIEVSASALSHFSKARSTGSHYSADGVFPAVAGAEGVGRTVDGRRVYFALPEAPYGALAEKALVRSGHMVEVPEEIDDVTAAAIANPAMSAWAALLERARMVAGETVLIHGATGTAGRLAVQLAKYLGASRVLATGRNEQDLCQLRDLGADATVAFHSGKLEEFERTLRQQLSGGVDVVLDYLWGESARSVLIAIAKSVEDRPVRFVHVGSASGEENMELPGAVLRSSTIQMMGSGMKSVSFRTLLHVVGKVFVAVGPAGLKVVAHAVPLPEVGQYWNAPGKPRVVFTIQGEPCGGDLYNQSRW